MYISTCTLSADISHQVVVQVGFKVTENGEHCLHYIPL